MLGGVRMVLKREITRLVVAASPLVLFASMSAQG